MAFSICWIAVETRARSLTPLRSIFTTNSQGKASFYVELVHANGQGLKFKPCRVNTKTDYMQLIAQVGQKVVIQQFTSGLASGFGGFPKSWGCPQIIQVMDDHDLVLNQPW